MCSVYQHKHRKQEIVTYRATSTHKQYYFVFRFGICALSVRVCINGKERCSRTRMPVTNLVHRYHRITYTTILCINCITTVYPYQIFVERLIYPNVGLLCVVRNCVIHMQILLYTIECSINITSACQGIGSITRMMRGAPRIRTGPG